MATSPSGEAIPQPALVFPVELLLLEAEEVLLELLDVLELDELDTRMLELLLELDLLLDELEMELELLALEVLELDELDTLEVELDLLLLDRDDELEDIDILLALLLELLTLTLDVLLATDELDDAAELELLAEMLD